jgi:antitoxin VapB
MTAQRKIIGPRQLNLKDDETYALASEVAKLSGETLNGAVKTALREKLERDNREATKADRLARLLALGRESAARVGARVMSDEDAIGYDEFGLPK